MLKLMSQSRWNEAVNETNGWLNVLDYNNKSRVFFSKLVHDDGANLLLTQHRQQKFIRRINQRNALARDVRYNLNIFQLISVKARTADLSYVSSVPSSSLFFFLSTPLYFSCFTCSMVGMYYTVNKVKDRQGMMFFRIVRI